MANFFIEDELDKLEQKRGETKEVLPEKIEMLAMMMATGRFSLEQLSQHLGITVGYISTMRKSPLFTNQVKKWQDQIYASVIEVAISDLLADSQDNVKFLRGVREGEIDDNPQSLRARIKAAELLLDRQVPKASSKSEDSSGVHITINADVRDRFDKAAIEIKGEDVAK